jgi:hypothetical protein
LYPLVHTPPIESAHPACHVHSAATVLHHDRAATALYGFTATVSLWRSPRRLGARRPSHPPSMLSPAHCCHAAPAFSLCAVTRLHDRAATGLHRDCATSAFSTASGCQAVIPLNLCVGHRATPTFTSVRRCLAPRHWQALHQWTPHVDEPPLAQAARRCCAENVSCKLIFQVFQVFLFGCFKSRSRCCICCNGYTRSMLQVYVPNVSFVSDICCNCFILVLQK